MAQCCSVSCEGTNRFFTRWSKRYAKGFRKKGPEKIQQLLLEGIRKAGTPSTEVLDIGCGVGALHLTMLQEGASRATGIDAAAGMIRQAELMAAELGLREKTTYVVGDFAEKAEGISTADVVMLDKVVCCYEDPENLVRRSLEKTRHVYALTRPSNRVLVRWAFALQILVARLFRAPFRPFWHDWERLESVIVQNGFARIYERATFLWNAAVFQRT